MTSIVFIDGREFLNRESRVREVATRLGLMQEVVDACFMSRSASLPYHNVQHCFSVALRAVEALEALGASERAVVKGFIAGLFHDFDYDVLASCDAVNIERAVAMVVRLGEDGLIPYSLVRSIACVIRATEFPHPVGGLPVFGEDRLVAEVVCDADLVQGWVGDRDSFMGGLEKERGTPASYRFPTLDLLYTQHFKNKHQEFLNTTP